MNTEIILAIISSIGGLGVGIFALIRYIISANNKAQTKFLEHIELKNGHLERVADKFNTTVEKFNETINNVEVNMAKQFSKNDNDHQRLFDELRK